MKHILTKLPNPFQNIFDRSMNPFFPISVIPKIAMLFQHIFLPYRFILPVLHLQNHGSTLQRLHRMPLPCRNVQSHGLPIGCQYDRLRTHPFQVIIILLHQLPAQAYYRFRSIPMTMDRHNRPRLYRILAFAATCHSHRFLNPNSSLVLDSPSPWRSIHPILLALYS